MVTLENALLKVVVSSEGAELQSVFNKKSNIEHLWQADAEIWGWHAPHLFPIVGQCSNNQLLVEERPYPALRHGFARHSHFKRMDSSDIHAKFSLNYSAETLAVYPFKFEFQVLYDLFDDHLRISYKVLNKDDKTIYFSVGAHPAFNVPFHDGEAYGDYFIEFEPNERLERHLLSANGYFTGAVQPVALIANRLQLHKDMFVDDALVFKKLKSRQVNIRSKNRREYVSVSYPHMDYLTLWAKSGADFICVEPLLGCPDMEGRSTELKDREAIQKVEHGHVFETDFTVGFHA